MSIDLSYWTGVEGFFLNNWISYLMQNTPMSKQDTDTLNLGV